MENGKLKKTSNEIAVQDSVSEYYEELRYARSYAWAYQEWWTRKMLSLLHPENLKGKILDNGCGTGVHAPLLGIEGGDVVGLDISAGMLGKAKLRISKLLLGDAQRLPFKDQSFNVIFARSLLHHLPYPEKGLSEINRILKNNGEAVFSDTNCSFLSNLPRKLAGKGEHFSDEHKNFNRNELLHIIETKLKIDRVCFFGYIAYPMIGFPDMIDLFKYVPFKNCLANFLIKLDELLSRLPVIQTQSWGIIIKASKRI